MGIRYTYNPEARGRDVASIFAGMDREMTNKDVCHCHACRTEAMNREGVAEPQPIPLMRVSDVSIGWDGRSVLEHVTFTVNKGDFIAITGPNGGGKTTLLRIMLGLLKPTEGKVTRVAGNLRIGYLPQKNMIDSHFPISVREVVESGLLGVKTVMMTDGEHVLDRNLRETLFNKVIEEIGMAEHVDRPIGFLSGGQLQRTLLGRAMISKPNLLVLDEPLSYIDKRFEHHLYELIERLSGTTTIVLVSHEMSTIAGMANRHFIVDRTLTQCQKHHHFEEF